RMLDSLIMRVADSVSVPAGSALAVDRVEFSRRVEEEISRLDRLRIHRAELTAIPDRGVTVVATGPLTSPALSEALARVFGDDHLYFYDAISPIVTADSIDMSRAFRAARYGKGGDDYINCPLNRRQYERLVDEIRAAKHMPLKGFERCAYFEGCMPVEELARRGRDTLRFGPMKPVGLHDPRSGAQAWAVLQLRQDDGAGRLFSMVGFQTKMTYPEQRRVFRLIPGMERAEFVRLGSLHRNTYINAPKLLDRGLQLRARRGVFVAGQLTGVEGYVESCATGLLCGINAARALGSRASVYPPPSTALGSLLAYITEDSKKNFQPMNANYGLFPPLEGRRIRGREKRRALGERALSELSGWLVDAGVVAGRAPLESSG
ncbi:MAG: methylenetetrahydrofolate--tRNA-(uracil(54)-C(5))-methyltransferase (FADH(2)-oxidizing) TrmFO, partial [Candidatus Binatia bacterium]